MTFQVDRSKIEMAFNALLQHAYSSHRTSQQSFPIKQSLVEDVLDAVMYTFLQEPVLLRLAPPIAVFGDTHGQFDDLIGWFDYVDWPPNRRCLFLGDYVDRGEYNIEVIVMVMILKVLHPNSIFLLRGNHEAVIVNRTYGFLDECDRRFNDGKHMYRRFNHAFSCMPLVALIDDQILCMHGGISPNLYSLDQIERIRRPIDVIDYGLICDLCWSDPDPSLDSDEPFAESMRGAGQRFSKDAAKEFCKKMQLSLIARAHQVPNDDRAFEFTFGTYQDKVMTIFSAPTYQRKMNEAGCMLLNDKMHGEFKILRPKNHEKAHK